MKPLFPFSDHLDLKSEGCKEAASDAAPTKQVTYPNNLSSSLQLRTQGSHSKSLHTVQKIHFPGIQSSVGTRTNVKCRP